MDKGLNPCHMAGHPLESELKSESYNTPPLGVLETLEEKFSDDPDALALNVTLLLGLAARVGEEFDIHGHDTNLLLGVPSQLMHAHLLERLADAGHKDTPVDTYDKVFVSIFDKLLHKLIGRSPDIMENYHEAALRELLVLELKSAVAYKRGLYEQGVMLDDMARYMLRRLRKDILEVSEDEFVDATHEQADQAMPIDVSRFHPDILEPFCDKDYWQYYCDSMGLAEARGDIGELNRLSRIGRSHLRWVKDQYMQIKYTRQLTRDN